MMAAHRRPNVVMVVLDSMRPEWLSCYAPEVETSPHIDRLARDGWLFETAIGPSAWTFPCMASIFTAMWPSKHGGHDEHQLLDTPYPTLAELFQRNDYQTAGFSDVPYVGPSTRLDRGFDLLSNLRANEVGLWHKGLKAAARGYRSLIGRYSKLNETPVLFGEAMAWLRAQRGSGRPFFLYLHSDETHAPFLPPAKYRLKYSGLSRSAMAAINQDKQLYVAGRVAMTGGDFRKLHALARGEAAYADAWVGRLMALLERLGELDHTVVVITADHGDNVGEHGLLRHGLCLYDTLLHVPFIIRPPGGAGGQRIRNMVRLIDLAPTLLTLCGIEEEEARVEMQGQDLVRAMDRKRFEPFAIAELYRPTQTMWRKKVPEFMPTFLERYDRRLRAYRTATHKLIWASDGRHELYDLMHDPGEVQNLHDAEPGLAADLHERLQGWLAGFEAGGAEEGFVVEEHADERVYERLRDLGYVE